MTSKMGWGFEVHEIITQITLRFAAYSNQYKVASKTIPARVLLDLGFGEMTSSFTFFLLGFVGICNVSGLKLITIKHSSGLSFMS